MTSAEQLHSLSHHAYCLIGGGEVRAELISVLEKKHKITTHGNPDFLDRTYETFTVDDARALKSLAGTRPVSEVGTKTFVLSMTGITVEAQNALLKLLEEPPEYVHFFLILPSAHLLLPTVRSRLSMIEGGRGREKGAGSGKQGEDGAALMKEAEAFLKAPSAKRLETIKSLMDAISKDKKTKQDAIGFIDAVEAAIYAQGGITGGVGKNQKALEAIAVARKYMNDRSPSLKMLLEYIALNL